MSTEIPDARMNEAEVLVVDDDPMMLRVFSKLLRLNGFGVLEASTGKEGLDIARDRVPALVLLDVRLPDVSGIEVCRRIKTDPKLQDVFVILVSGEAVSPAHKVDGFEVGADEYLAKPLDAEELLARIRTGMRLRETTVALRASREHYRRLIELLPDAVGVLDLRGGITSVNPRAVAILGYGDPAELVGKNVFDITPEEGRSQLRAELAGSLRRGILQNIECRALRKDGTAIPVELNLAVTRDTKGRRRGYVLVARDISERKRAQEQIRSLSVALENTHELVSISDEQKHRAEEQNRLLARALESIHELVWISDENSRIQFVNQAALQALGYTESEMLRRAQSFLYSRSNPDWLLGRLQKNADRDGWRGEVLAARKNGGEFPIFLSICPIKGRSGSALGCVGVALDISEQKQTEMALRELATIVENSDAAIISRSLDGRILSWNRGAERLFGYRADEIKGRPMSVLVPADQMDDPWGTTEALNHEGYLEPVEAFRIRKDGALIETSATLSPLKDSSGNTIGASIIARDITERKRLQKAVLEVSEREQRRMGQDLHDGLCQRLFFTAMNCNLLKDTLASKGCPEVEDVGRILSQLDAAMTEARGLAHGLSLSNLARNGIETALRDLAQTTNRDFRIACEVECPIPVVIQDPAVATHLYRIAREGVHNAVKHAKPSRIFICLTASSAVGCLSVVDDGVGIPPAQCRTGGMGLEMMKYRADLIGGEMKVNPGPGGGTVLACTFPMQVLECQ